MHVVFFGLSLTSSWGNGHATTYRGLLGGLQQLQHTTEFFERDVPWYAEHRDLPCPPQTRLHLYRDWDQIRPQALASARAADAVIVGSYFPDAIAALDDLLGNCPAPVCFYDIDTPITLRQLERDHRPSGDGQRVQESCPYLLPRHISAVDLYLSFTGGPVLSELSERWHARRVRPLYCTCDERDYCPKASVLPAAAAHPVALSFLGTYAPDRQAKLERLLLEPARRHPELRFEVAGSMYPETRTWPANLTHTAHLPPAEHPRFYGRSRLTLNLTRQAMVEAGYSPSIRLFEAAACATAIVSDPWPGLDEFFASGREILVASDTAEMCALLEQVSPEQAEAIGLAARDRVLAHHTGRCRAQELVSYLKPLHRQAPANA